MSKTSRLLCSIDVSLGSMTIIRFRCFVVVKRHSCPAQTAFLHDLQIILNVISAQLFAKPFLLPSLIVFLLLSLDYFVYKAINVAYTPDARCSGAQSLKDMKSKIGFCRFRMWKCFEQFYRKTCLIRDCIMLTLLLWMCAFNVAKTILFLRLALCRSFERFKNSARCLRKSLIAFVIFAQYRQLIKS